MIVSSLSAPFLAERGHHISSRLLDELRDGKLELRPLDVV